MYHKEKRAGSGSLSSAMPLSPVGAEGGISSGSVLVLTSSRKVPFVSHVLWPEGSVQSVE